MAKIVFIILIISAVIGVGSIIYKGRKNYHYPILLTVIVLLFISSMFLKYKLFTFNILSTIISFILLSVVIFTIIDFFSGKKKDKKDDKDNDNEHK